MLKAGTKVRIIDFPMCDLACMFGGFSVGDIGVIKGKYDDVEDDECHWYSVEFKNDNVQYLPEVWFEVVYKPTEKEPKNVSKEDTPKVFTPHLVFVDDNTFVGNIGESTNLKTSKGNPLCVGDIVETNDGLSVAVKDEEGEYFMGYRRMLLSDIFASTKVIKKFSYEDPWDGDIITAVKYVKEPECDE